MASSYASVLLTSTMMVIIGLLLQADTTNGVCCGYRGNNFGCCGVGPCNIFCCNCDGGCITRPDGCIFGDAKPNTRFSILSQSSAEYDVTRKNFDLIDINKDNTIDFSEGLLYLQNTTGRFLSKYVDVQNDSSMLALAFEVLDSNSNGVVEPHEFDRSLA